MATLIRAYEDYKKDIDIKYPKDEKGKLMGTSNVRFLLDLIEITVLF